MNGTTTKASSSSTAGATMISAARVSRRLVVGGSSSAGSDVGGTVTTVLTRASLSSRDERPCRRGLDGPRRRGSLVGAVAVVVFVVLIDCLGRLVELGLGVRALVGVEECLGELLADHRVGRGDRPGGGHTGFGGRVGAASLGQTLAEQLQRA